MNNAQSAHSSCLSITEDVDPGVQRMALDTKLLYPDRDYRRRFEGRLREFLKVDTCAKVIGYHDGVVSYLTESVIPAKRDSRPPLLLLFGNPAPESVQRGCFFAGEKNRREHRFWRTLRESGVISFGESGGYMDASRTRALFDLAYASPFRVGLAVFYSMPSPASDPKWSGVAGLRRLFGARAFREIAECEKRRLESLIGGFVGQPGGAVVAFQKDAYWGVKDCGSPERAVAHEGGWHLLEARCADSKARLFGMPPTRYMNARWYGEFLRRAAGLSGKYPE